MIASPIRGADTCDSGTPWRVRHRISCELPARAIARVHFKMEAASRPMNHLKRIRLVALLSISFLIAFGICGNPASARQASSGMMAGKIKCQGGDWVNVTVDAEQSLPLQVVDKAACNEAITVLSDPQAYTVKIRTASGKIGYVTRYEVVADPDAPIKSPPIIIMKGNASHDQAPAQQMKPATAVTAAPQDTGPHKPKVYISDSQSWEDTGGFGNAPNGNSETLYAGYNPEMVDVYENFTADCSAVTVVQEKSGADYAILFDKGSSKKGVKGLGGLVKVNKITVLTRTGETLLSQESHSADTAVKVACSAIAQKSGATSSGSPTQ